MEPGTGQPGPVDRQRPLFSRIPVPARLRVMLASGAPGGPGALAVRGRAQRLALMALVAIPMVFNAIALWPEVSVDAPNVNDDAFHYLMVRRANDALSNGENVLDHWGPELDLGVPRFLYYQNLPTLAVVGLHRLLFQQVDIFLVLNIVRYVLMVGLPLTFYWSMRQMQFSAPAAAAGAAFSSLLAADHRYGLEYDSFIWRGWGMFTQLWAIHLSLITLVCLWRLAQTGRGVALSIAACSALVLSHLLYSEMMVVSGTIVFLVGLNRQNIRTRARNFAVVGAVTAVVTSYLWLSLLQDQAYFGQSPYEDKTHFDSFGAPTILRWLVTGELFDDSRWPLFTLIAAVGLGGLVLARTRQGLFAAAIFGTWLVLYFGRDVWGPLVEPLPAGDRILFHRFISPMQIGAIFLMGLGAEWLWRAGSRLPRAAGGLAATAVVAVLLVPAMVERQSFYDDNEAWMKRTELAIATDADAREILQTLRTLPPGRVHAGLRSNWGRLMTFGDLQFYRYLLHEGFWVVSPPLGTFNLNADLMFHFNESDVGHYDLFNARYVIARAGYELPSELVPLKTTTRYTLYEAPTSGYATFAARVERRNAATQIDLFVENRAWLSGPGPAGRQFIRWDYPSKTTPSTPPATSGCATTGRIFGEQVEPGQIDELTDCGQPSTVVLKVTYHPNWRVTVDGREQETFMVSPSYIGVEVPAGLHHVRAEYRSSPLRTALFFAGLATLVAVFAAPVLYRRSASRRERRTGPGYDGRTSSPPETR